MCAREAAGMGVPECVRLSGCVRVRVCAGGGAWLEQSVCSQTWDLRGAVRTGVRVCVCMLTPERLPGCELTCD